MDTVENQSVEQIVAILKAASPAELIKFANYLDVKPSKNQDADRHRLAQVYYDSAITYLRSENFVLTMDAIISFGLLKLFAKRRNEYISIANSLISDKKELIYRRLLYKMALMANIAIEFDFPSKSNLAAAQSQSIEDYLHAVMICFFHGNLDKRPQRVRYELEQHLQTILTRPIYVNDAIEDIITIMKILEIKIETTEKIDTKGLTFSRVVAAIGTSFEKTYNHTGAMGNDLFTYKSPLATWILININKKLRLFGPKIASNR